MGYIPMTPNAKRSGEQFLGVAVECYPAFSCLDAWWEEGRDLRAYYHIELMFRKKLTRRSLETPKGFEEGAW